MVNSRLCETGDAGLKIRDRDLSFFIKSVTETLLLKIRVQDSRC